jgi:hypothetical protein
MFYRVLQLTYGTFFVNDIALQHSAVLQSFTMATALQSLLQKFSKKELCSSDLYEGRLCQIFETLANMSFY